MIAACFLPWFCIAGTSIAIHSFSFSATIKCGRYFCGVCQSRANRTGTHSDGKGAVFYGKKRTIGNHLPYMQ
jgi:hypothetical protein